MKNILKKLFEAKKRVASQKMTKEGKNTFSNYSYFTPEQVCSLVQKACEEFNLLTKFDLVRDEKGIEGRLTIYDIDSEETMQFIGATAIPEIKATNVAQQIGGCMTFTERYLKMTAFGISDSSLDFDTTENTKKNVESKKEGSTEKGSTEKPRFNKEQLRALMSEDEETIKYLRKYDTSNALIENIETKYRISKEMKMKIADVRAENK